MIPVVPEHLHWARGNCTSIRYFIDDTPICLLQPRVREGAGDYFAPMTFFRRRFREDARGGTPSPLDIAHLRLEDATCKDFRGLNVPGRGIRRRRRWHRTYRSLKAALAPDRLVAVLRRRSRRA